MQAKQHNNLFTRIFRFIRVKLGQFFRWYKQKWVSYTHNKYGEFIYKRGGMMAAATLATALIVPLLICTALQAGYYFSTSKQETIYLSQSEEIYPDENIWGVRGCYTPRCDSDSSIYFRIKPSLFHHLWNFAHSGHFFLPDVVGSSVPTGQTRCEVISYGVRMRMTMMFNIYPIILKVTCEGEATNGGAAGKQ